MSKTVSDELDNIFKIVNEWLKFAEQKNAALLVLNSGSVWGISLFLRNQDALPCSGLTFVALGLALVFISSLICISSFMPLLYKPIYSSNLGKRNNLDNCVYFGDIAKYEEDDYLALLKHKLGEEAEHSLFERDFASQIVTNARITLAKYKKFKLSSILTIIGFVFFGLTALTIYTGKIF